MTLAGVSPFLWLALLATLMVGCGPCSVASGPKEKTSGESVVVEVNSKAPAFAAQSLDGKTVRLADYVGRRVVLLEFWSVFCKSCIEEMPRIEALYRTYGPSGLAVLSINTDVFSPARVASALKKAGIYPSYPVVRDPRQEVVGAYGVECSR
jgi:peroxiredoxin